MERNWLDDLYERACARGEAERLAKRVDREPLASDGPEYQADHAWWTSRQAGALKWTVDEEAQRLGFIGAGLEPTLRHYWRGCPTDVLTATLREYVRAAESSQGEVRPDALDGVIADLKIELQYRGAGVTA